MCTSHTICVYTTCIDTHFSATAAVFARFAQGERLPRPSGCPDGLWALIESCWREAPEQRPPFNAILPAVEEEIGLVDAAEQQERQRQQERQQQQEKQQQQQEEDEQRAAGLGRQMEVGRQQGMHTGRGHHRGRDSVRAQLQVLRARRHHNQPTAEGATPGVVATALAARRVAVPAAAAPTAVQAKAECGTHYQTRGSLLSKSSGDELMQDGGAQGEGGGFAEGSCVGSTIAGRRSDSSGSGVDAAARVF
jgi:hypothetical protein